MRITNDNYFSLEASREYFSVSQYKTFLDCPARAMAEIRGEYKEPMTTALLVGSYVDAYFEGTLDKFREEHPEIFNISVKERSDTITLVHGVAPELVTRNLTWKPGGLAEAKRRYPAFFEAVFALKADYVQAEEIIKRIEADELFMAYMSGKKQVIKTAELFGAPWKIKIDSYLSPSDVKSLVKRFPENEKFFIEGCGAIDDLKVMRALDRIMGKSFVEHWMYDLQTAVYAEVEYLASRRKQKQRVPTFLSVATKEDETHLELVHIPHWRHQECLADVEKNMPKFIAYKNGELEAPRCGTCAYCRKTKKLKAPIDFELVGFSNKEIALMQGKIF